MEYSVAALTIGVAVKLVFVGDTFVFNVEITFGPDIGVPFGPVNVTVDIGCHLFVVDKMDDAGVVDDTGALDAEGGTTFMIGLENIVGLAFASGRPVTGSRVPLAKCNEHIYSDV